MVVLVVVLGGLGLVFAVPGGRTPAGVFAAAVLLLGLARGATQQLAESPGPPLEADRRGMPGLLREVTVTAAATPGPRCRVSVVTARGQAAELALPPTACPLARGDRLAVRSAELHTDAARAQPLSRAPYPVSYVWRRPTSRPRWSLTRGVSRSVAAIRQAGWTAAHGRPDRGFVVACSLGLPAALPPDARARLQRAGLGHLIAVSGLHVGLAAWLWLAAFRRAFARWWWGARAAVCASALPVVAFVMLTGAGAPAVRAALMYALVAAGSVLGRPTHSPTVLLVAGAAMLFVRPQWLTEPGFQLSVAAMVVLVALPAPVTPAFTSWHLGWALLPLLWIHFDATSDGSVLANAIAMPVFALWVVPTAVLGWLAFPWLGGLALEPSAAGAALILDVAHAVSTLPELPRWIWVAGAAATWVPGLRSRLSASARRWLPHRGAALLLLGVAAVSMTPAQPSTGWIAWATPRRPEVLSVDAEGAACVQHPSASARVWRARLEQAGVRRVVGVATTASGDDPAHLAWRRAIMRGVSPSRGVPRCELPGPPEVRAALSVCTLYSPTPVARRMAGDGVQCWSARQGAWRPAPLHFDGIAS